MEALPETGNLPVMLVTDGEGIDDKTFNQLAYEAFAKVDPPSTKYGLPTAIYGKDSTRYYVESTSVEVGDLENGYTTATNNLVVRTLILLIQPEEILVFLMPRFMQCWLMLLQLLVIMKKHVSKWNMQKN